MSSRTAHLAVCLAIAAVAGAAQAAEPSRPAPALVDSAKKPAPSCGELPRGSRAYKDCLTRQSRRDTGAGQATVKPVFSSR